MNWSAWEFYMERSLMFIERLMWWLCKWSLDLRSLNHLIYIYIWYALILLHVILSEVTKRQILSVAWTIWRYLNDQKRIHHPRWIRKKGFIYSQIVLIEKSLANIEWDLKKVSNIIQMINNNIKNKYDLTWQTYFML